MSCVSARVQSAFLESFGARPAHLVRAPGRVNLIGEHTDYSGGFAMPLALEQAVWIAFRPRRDRRLLLHSLDYGETCELDLGRPLRSADGWQEYLKGIVWVLAESGRRLCGWEGVLAGDVPRGAGLASSAALEVALARVFVELSGLPWEARVFAERVQRAENEWVGVRCGILDPLASACGVAGHVLRIDCRSLAIEPLPFPSQVRLLALDTATRRGLIDSAYNERRAQCETVARSFDRSQLRDVGFEELLEGAGMLEPRLFRRARHVLGENRRVEESADALRADDYQRLGTLMQRSHESLRDDFEVSSPALDAIVEAALEIPGCLGARMTGAGFGGCAVALVETGEASDFALALPEVYRRRTGLEAKIYPCTPSAGAECLGPSP